MLREQFDDNDVQEILKRAVSIDVIEGANLQQRLSMAAEELGISRESVELAQEQWLRDKVRTQKLQAAKKKRLQDFGIHAGVYAVVNGFLIVMNLLTMNSAREFWAIYPMLGWGIGLAIHALTLKMPLDVDDESERGQIARGTDRA